LPRVLLVEDEPDVREMLAQTLEAEGTETVATASGRAALTELCAATAEGRTYDAIVLDIVMPDIDGWDVLEAVRSNPLWRGIPVVVVTGYANDTQALARISRYEAVCVQKNGNFLGTVRAALGRLVGAAEAP